MRFYIGIILAGILLVLNCGINETPYPPKIISIPTFGFIGRAYNIVVSAEDPNEDSVAFLADWGDGTHSDWSEYTACGLSYAFANIWQNPGEYRVKAKAKDTKDATSNWSYEYKIIIYDTLNNPPGIPLKPSGPTSGFVNANYSFTTSSTDIEGDNIAYQFDWGDGTQSVWSNFIPSGNNITMMKSWSLAGTYSIKARAKDTEGAISGWSENCSIEIDTAGTFPRNIVGSVSVGDGPIECAVTPNGNYVYVSHRYTNMVYVIRTSDNVVTRTIPVGDAPYGVAITPDGNYIYVTNRFSYDVSVIRTSDNTVISTIPVGEWPIYCAITPDGNYVYTANWGTSNVSVINTQTNTVVATIPVNYAPGCVCITPDGQYAYVSNMGGNNISVIRLSDNAVVATVQAGNYPQGLAITPDGQYVYCANKQGNTITVIRTSDNTVFATINAPNGPDRLAVLPGGQYVYVSEEYGYNVNIIRVSDNTIIETIPVGNMTQGVAPTPNGNKLYVAVFNENKVKIIGY